MAVAKTATMRTAPNKNALTSMPLFYHVGILRQMHNPADINVLSTVVFDLGPFGIQVVASPRHADGIIVTGPVSNNMHKALLDTYQAIPDPRLVIAVGSCAISGGPFSGQPQVCGGLEGIAPVDLYIPGCPPHPLTILDGLLRLQGRLK